jgi:hypothetical protein
MMRLSLLAAVSLAALVAFAHSQSNPGLSGGQVPTPGQWNSYFSAKQDVLGFTPVNKAGDTMGGVLNTNTSSTAGAGFNLGIGAAPSSPNNGDVWMTASGIFVRAGGTTVGPLSAGTSALAGGVSGQLQYNNAGNLGGFTMAGDCTTVQPNITCTKTNGTNFGALATLGVGTGLISSGGNLNLNTPVSPTNGGTGVNNVSSTVTLSQNLAVTGTGGLTLNTGGATNSTLPIGTQTLASLTGTGQTITGGTTVTTLSIATGNYTVNCGNRPFQAINNSGAFTITAPTTDSSCLLAVFNQPGAVVPTFSGFSVGANTGDGLDAVNGHAFTINIWRINAVSGYRVAAHQ